MTTETTPNPTNIEGPHCQCCGTTDREYIGYEATRESEGYSACCNEIVIDNFGVDFAGRPFRCNPRDCYHA